MIASIVIIALTATLLVYWFHYSCVLILESDWNDEQAREIAAQNELIFHKVEDVLTNARSAEEVDRVRDLLDRDLQRVLSMMAGGERSLESRMLTANFQVAKAWYSATRNVAGPKAHNALRSMSRIVGYLAGEVGDQLATARG